MTGHQELTCTDKTRLDVDEKELEILQFRRRLQHPKQSLRVLIFNATGGCVECIGQRQVGHRLENDCDVGRRKCDKAMVKLAFELSLVWRDERDRRACVLRTRCRHVACTLIGD